MPTKKLQNFALALTCILSVLGLVEVGARLYRHKSFQMQNFAKTENFHFFNVPFHQFDKSLGWAPRPGFYPNEKIRVLPNTLRSNGRKEETLKGETILVVGDSFAWGTEVDDATTWPSLLEKRLHSRVLNGAVQGYGFDQSVLRAETLAKIYRPNWIIVSFTPPYNILRCEYSYQHAHKPYFEIQSGKAVLKEMPSEATPMAPERNFDLAHRIFGYSYFAGWVFSRLAPEYWWGLYEKREHDRGAEVACLLLERLARFSEGIGSRVLVVAQYTEKFHGEDVAENVLSCARKANLLTLDLSPDARKLAKDERKRYQSFYDGRLHMNGRGNEWVANTIAKALKDSPHSYSALSR